MSEQTQFSRPMEVSHVERQLAEFKSRITGEALGLEMSMALWEQLGCPGRVTVVVLVDRG